MEESHLLHIYLTRHGETEWNIENRLQGWKDSNLTSKGIRDAELLSKKLSTIDFKNIYTSSSNRAIKTAMILRGEKNFPIIEENRLKEINFGEWEGRTKLEINERFEKEFSSLWDSPHLYNHIPHSGEGLEDLMNRVQNALNDIINTNNNGNILIVTHAVVLATIVSYLKKSSIEKLWDIPFVHGTSLTHIEMDKDQKKLEFKLLCDTSHLELV